MLFTWSGVYKCSHWMFITHQFQTCKNTTPLQPSKELLQDLQGWRILQNDSSHGFCMDFVLFVSPFFYVVLLLLFHIIALSCLKLGPLRTRSTLHGSLPQSWWRQRVQRVSRGLHNEATFTPTEIAKIRTPYNFRASQSWSILHLIASKPCPIGNKCLGWTSKQIILFHRANGILFCLRHSDCLSARSNSASAVTLLQFPGKSMRMCSKNRTNRPTRVIHLSAQKPQVSLCRRNLPYWADPVDPCASWHLAFWRNASADLAANDNQLPGAATCCHFRRPIWPRVCALSWECSQDLVPTWAWPSTTLNSTIYGHLFEPIPLDPRLGP